MQQRIDQIKLFDGAVATASSVASPIADWTHLFLSCYTASSANFTCKIQISHQVDKPDFSSAASVTNQWSYVQIKNLIAGTNIDGGTGIVATGTDIAADYEVNINGARWIGATITARSAGAVTLWVSGKNNQ